MDARKLFTIGNDRQAALTAQRDAGLRGVFAFPGRIPEGGFTPRPEDSKHQHDPADHDRDRDKPPDYAPKLMCRTYAGDLGARPLAPGAAFWESPDIWVVAPDGSDVPVVGQVNQVHVHVWNLGPAPAYGVQVDVYWCNPSVGINLASATLIGSESIVLNASEHRVLSFPWMPVLVNGGHECLVAEVFDPVSDNLAAPFNPVLDRHVAQRNVKVITVPAGQSLHLEFMVPNLSRLNVNSELQLHEVRGDAFQLLGTIVGDAVSAGARGSMATISDVQIRQAQTVLNLGKHPVAAVFRETMNRAPSNYARGLLKGARMMLSDEDKLKAPRTENLQADTQRTGNQRAVASSRVVAERAFEVMASRFIDLPANRAATVTLTLTAPERASVGTAFAYRVVEVVEGVVTGGMTYIVRIKK